MNPDMRREGCLENQREFILAGTWRVKGKVVQEVMEVERDARVETPAAKLPLGGSQPRSISDAISITLAGNDGGSV